MDCGVFLRFAFFGPWGLVAQEIRRENDFGGPLFFDTGPYVPPGVGASTFVL